MIGMVVHPEINSQSVAIFIRGDHSVGTFIELLGHYQCETENKKGTSKFWLLHDFMEQFFASATAGTHPENSLIRIAESEWQCQL